MSTQRPADTTQWAEHDKQAYAERFIGEPASRNQTIRKFRATYNDTLHLWLLPAATQMYDPVRLVNGVRTICEESRKTRAHLTRRQALDAAGIDDKGDGIYELLPPEMFMLFGSYPMHNVSNQFNTHFANPRYVHDHPESVTDKDERVEWLRRYALTGFCECDDVAPHFGLSSAHAVQKYIWRHDIPWSEWRKEGRKRRDRTWATLHRWGYAYTTISDAFGCPDSTVRGRVHEVRESGFVPPARPEWHDEKLPDEYDTSRAAVGLD